MPEGNQLLPKQHLQWCELELLLRAGPQVGDNKSYYAFPRFHRPSDDDDNFMPNIPPVVVEHMRLAACKRDPVLYGRTLWAMLFGDVQMRLLLNRAMANARALHLALRLRLLIGHDAIELHALWWETLIDPATDSPILMHEDFMFSRYLASKVGTPLGPPPANRMRVLFAVADPADLGEWEANGRPLGKPDMGGLPLLHELADQHDVVTLGERVPVTLDNLVARMDQGVDVLYLVCHGALVNGESRLFLENDAGKTAVVSGENLAASLRDMLSRPRLVVLASCQSAGTGAGCMVGDDGELAALGPRLMDAGVPSVIAMQGNVSERTVRRFMPVLFQQLSAHGQIERAMAVARASVREHQDWWVPVLFTRIKSGQLWDRAALPADIAGPPYDWQRVVDDLNTNTSVMVLGSGMGEEVLGSSRDIARRWVEENKLPLAPQLRDSLPQVAQYLACTQNSDYPLMLLREYLICSLRMRHAALLAGYRANAGAHDELDMLVREIGRRKRREFEERQSANDRAQEQALQLGCPVILPYPNLQEPLYSRIARLPVTTYVTTNRDNLLLESLEAEGRHPEVAVCRWKPMLPDGMSTSEQDWPPSVFDTDPGFEPTYERPLIYHVFGYTNAPQTVVLTEDDYFDFLVGLSRNQGNPRTRMPAHIKKVLATHGLVFLGFQFDDWEFRTMFRGVLPREGIEAGGNHANVAVQVEPSDVSVGTPDDARNYMQKYFSRHREIQVYWGNPDDYLKELSKQWKWSRQ
jgi:hypothetical protein